MLFDEAPVSEQGWDEVVAGFPDATVYQSAGWARAKGDRCEARRLVLTGDDDKPLAAAQLLVRRLGPGVRAAYVPGGPLLAADRTDDVELARRAVAEVEREAADAGCAVVFVQPSRRDRVTEELLGRGGYRPAPVQVGMTAGLEVPLGAGPDELFERMAKSRRRNVRRSQRRGAVISIGGRDDLDDFHRLHTESARHHGFLPMSAEYLHRQWAGLHPGGHFHLIVGRVEGDPTVRAAGVMFTFGRWAEFKLTGWDGSDEAAGAFLNEAIQWHMMERAEADGYAWFETGGLPRDQAIEAERVGLDAALRGTPSEFKHGWGGKLAVYPATHEKVLRPSGHVLYRLPSRFLADDGAGGRLINWIRRT